MHGSRLALTNYTTLMSRPALCPAAVGLLLANYGLAMWMALQPHMGFNPAVMFGGHALLAATLAFRTFKLDAAK